jgi:hypothetical protein
MSKKTEKDKKEDGKYVQGSASEAGTAPNLNKFSNRKLVKWTKRTPKRQKQNLAPKISGLKSLGGSSLKTMRLK